MRGTSVGKGGNRVLIESGGLGESVGVLNLTVGKSSDKDELTIPGSLEDFTWGKLSNIEFLIGVSDVTSPGDHLIVDNSDDGLNSKSVTREDEALEHVDLGSLDFVILVLFVPKSIFVEPVIGLGFGIKWVAEV